MSARIENLAARRAQRKAYRSGPEEPRGAAKDDAPHPPESKRAGGRCPICGKPRSEAHRPFCSARCAEVDLGRWLKESYRVPVEEKPGDADPDESS
jgi:endogenous inhibitor of DNA gyrase (YacG/DUF329 family)